MDDELFWKRYQASKISKFDPNKPWDFKIRQPEWMLDKLIPARSIGMVYGPSNSGKSHIICDIIANMIHGNTEWQGIPIKPGNVVMFSESLGHIQARMKAYVTNIEGELQFGLYSLPNLALDTRDIDLVEAWLMSMEHAPMMAIFDTLATAFAFDENDNREASKLIAALEERILPLLDPAGTIILAHHTSKMSEGKSARGASALIGNIDYSINVLYDKKANLTIANWEKDRWRLVEEPPAWAGTMRRVPVEFENGSAEMSILDWEPYSQEAQDMAAQLADELQNDLIRKEVDDIVDGWQGEKYIHETGKRPAAPSGRVPVQFPHQYDGKRREIYEHLRSTRKIEEVHNKNGVHTGFVIIK